MHINVSTESEYDFCLKYLRIWAGVLSGGQPITNVEVRILAAMMVKRRELQRDGLKGEKLLTLLWSTQEREDILANSGVSEGSFYNKISQLKKKGLITGERDFIPQIIPEQEITFTFHVAQET